VFEDKATMSEPKTFETGWIGAPASFSFLPSLNISLLDPPNDLRESATPLFSVNFLAFFILQFLVCSCIDLLT
jgi:hypothetical protein